MRDRSIWRDLLGLAPPWRERVLTGDQLERVLQATQNREPKAHSLLLFLADTGVRIGEALALQWTDVDFAAGPPGSSAASITWAASGRRRPAVLGW